MNALSNILINQIFIIDMRASCEKEQPHKTISYKVTKIKFITINFSHFLRKILPYNEGTSRDVSRTAFEHPLWNLLSYNF